ncbi:MAG: hypothetical protein NTU95_05615 [Methanothrix sp.]|nr:hypothetical protein [Methanothrix sp.]
MVHDVQAMREAREQKKRAQVLARESRALEGIEGAALLAGEKEAETARLKEQARELHEQARLEDLSVWEDCIVKQIKKGEKRYGRWLAGWREGDRVRKVYLGSCKKMSQAEALQKARKMKAEVLGIKAPASCT